MKQKINKPYFYAHWKDFNTGELKKVDVLKFIFNDILTKDNKIDKERFVYYDKEHDYKPQPIQTKKQFAEYLNRDLMYYFWGKCEWEFIVVDWPCKEKIDDSRPKKVSVYDQIKPNLDIITDLAWNYIVSIL